MPDSTFSEHELVAYLDEALPVEQMSDFEDALRQSEELRRRLAGGLGCWRASEVLPGPCRWSSPLQGMWRAGGRCNDSHMRVSGALRIGVGGGGDGSRGGSIGDARVCGGRGGSTVNMVCVGR